MKDYIGYYTDLIPPPICDAIIGHVENERLSDFENLHIQTQMVWWNLMIVYVWMRYGFFKITNFMMY